MKKLILFVALLLTFSSPTFSARAENARYSQIITDGVYLYIDSTLTIKWFELPVGYYVKVISVSHSSAKVEYKSDNPKIPSAKGYVSTESLNIVSSAPQVLYPTDTFSVNQNCLLYKDTDMTISETVTQGSIVDYYGIIDKEDGKTYVYGYVKTLSGDEYVGYLLSSCITDFYEPYLPIEKQEVFESASESLTNSSSQTNFASTLQLVIIIAVSIVAISIVYLLFKPSQSKAKDEVATKSEWDDE